MKVQYYPKVSRETVEHVVAAVAAPAMHSFKEDILYERAHGRKKSDLEAEGKHPNKYGLECLAKGKVLEGP